MADSPIASDTRLPQITRANTSRPMLSVPIQCSAEGDCSMSAVLALIASTNGSQGARSAARLISRRKPTGSQNGIPSVFASCSASSPATTASMAVWPPHRERSASRARWWCYARDRACRILGSRAAHTGPRGSDDHERHRDQHDRALHDEVVALEDGRHEQLADAVDGEDLLDDDRAADELTHIDGGHGEQREVDGLSAAGRGSRRWHALRPGNPDVVLLQGGDHVRAQQARSRRSARLRAREQAGSSLEVLTGTLPEGRVARRG